MRIKPSPVKIVTEDNDIVTRKGLLGEASITLSHLVGVQIKLCHALNARRRPRLRVESHKAYNRIEMRDPSRISPVLTND